MQSQDRPAGGDRCRFGASRPRFTSNFPLPDWSVLRLQVLPLDQALPKHEFKVLETKSRGGRQGRGKPVEPVTGDKVPVKGQVFVAFTKEKTPRVYVSIAFDAHAKDVQLEIQAACDIAGNMLPFNFASLQGADARLGEYLRVSDTDKNPNKKNMQDQIQAWKKTRDDLKALGELGVELNQKASIPFRVYAVLGETDDEAHRVVIFQSGQVDNPKANGPKKNPKVNRKKGVRRIRCRGVETIVKSLLALTLCLPLSLATAQPPAGPGDKSVQQWAEQLNSAEFREQWYAAYVLGTLGPQAALAAPALHAVLDVKSNNEYSRSMAAWALGRIGPAAQREIPFSIETMHSTVMQHGRPGSSHSTPSGLPPVTAKPAMRSDRRQGPRCDRLHAPTVSVFTRDNSTADVDSFGRF